MRQIMEAAAYIISAIITAFGGIWYKRRLARRDQSRRAVHAHNRISEALATLRYKTGALRVVVVRTHNGGGVPSAKTPLFTSALYEATTVEPLHDDWQGMSVDAEMIDHLSRLLKDHVVCVHIDDLDPSGTMMRLYASDKHVAAKTVHKYYLTHDKKNVYYLSLQWEDERHAPSNRDLLLTERTVNDIRDILSS